MSFFSKLLKVISHKKYQKNPLGKKLSPLQQSVLNIGAVNAEQTMFTVIHWKPALRKRKLEII